MPNLLGINGLLIINCDIVLIVIKREEFERVGKPTIALLYSCKIS